jgi:hypothetical protein
VLDGTPLVRIELGEISSHEKDWHESVVP